MRHVFYIRHSLPAGDVFFHYFTCILIGPWDQIDLPDQLALSPSLESDHDYDLHLEGGRRGGLRVFTCDSVS